MRNGKQSREYYFRNGVLKERAIWYIIFRAAGKNLPGLKPGENKRRGQPFAPSAKKETFIMNMGTNLRIMGAVVSAVFALCFYSLAAAAEKGPTEIKQTDKCHVCGMFVAKYNGWIAQVIFSDGTYAAFDGPKDMFKFYFDPGKYNPSRKKSDITKLYVTEYYSTRLMDAEKLFFVERSDVYGPMGAELIPIKSMEAAREFMGDHKGRKILKFGEIKPGDLK